MAQPRRAWTASLRRLEFVLVSLVFHLVFIWSIFDIYFHSPVVYPGVRFDARHAVPGAPALREPPPARRLVLIVADGLRADTMFQAHPWERLPPWAQRDAASASGEPAMASFPSALTQRNGSGPADGVHPSRVFAAPYLREAARQRGTWGISHTRVPTESRPGHVALIAGMYEDMSAVTRGWKVNPLAFDSLLNQSSYAFAYGSPDIVPMFVLGTAPGRAEWATYEEEAEDFTKDAVELDVWVLGQLRALLERARRDRALDARLRAPGAVLFLHLLGLDTTGHTYRPFSPEYVGNTIVVDAIVRETERMLEAYYADGKTAYVVTADHGMSVKGNHGDGDPDSTRTPLVAWGAGVARPVPAAPGADSVPEAEAALSADASSKEAAYYAHWHMSDRQREDVVQADLAPLMASLVGVPVPANAEGRLPLAYLDASSAYRAHALLANARQVLEVYRVKHLDRAQRMLYYRPYPPLAQAPGEAAPGEQRVAHIATLVAAGNLDGAAAASDALIHDALAGAKYLHQYDWLVLSAVVVLGYVGLLLYGAAFLLGYYALDEGAAGGAARAGAGAGDAARAGAGADAPVRPPAGALGVLVAAVAVLWGKFAAERSPWHYYVYSGATALIWARFLRRAHVLREVWDTAVQRAAAARGGDVTGARRGLLAKLGMFLALSLGMLELMVLGYETRWVWSLPLVVLGVLWPMVIQTDFKAEREILMLAWTLLSVGNAAFMFSDTDKGEDLRLLAASGVLLLLLGVWVWSCPDVFLGDAEYAGKPDGPADVFLERTLRALACTLALLAAAIVVAVHAAVSLASKRGLPLPDQVAGWAILILSFTLPYVIGFQRPRPQADGPPLRQPLRQRFVLFAFAFAPVFVLLSLCDEVLYYTVYVLHMVVWAALEAELARLRSGARTVDAPAQRPAKTTAVEATPAPAPRGLTLDDVRVGIFFLTFLHAGFFGTGNVASISSFYLSPVYRLVPVFSPFLMAALLLVKLLVPLVLLMSLLHGLCAAPVERRPPPAWTRRFPILGSGLGMRDVYIPILVATLAADVLALNFFFAIRDSGSWLEIGQSITHFVMANLLQVFMLLLATLSAEIMGAHGAPAADAAAAADAAPST